MLKLRKKIDAAFCNPGIISYPHISESSDEEIYDNNEPKSPVF